MHIPTKFLLSHSWTLDNPWGGAYGCHPKSVVVYPYTYDVAYGQQDTFKNIVGFKDSISYEILQYQPSGTPVSDSLHQKDTDGRFDRTHHAKPSGQAEEFVVKIQKIKSVSDDIEWNTK